MSPRKTTLGLTLLLAMLAMPCMAASSAPVLLGLDTPIVRNAGEFFEYQIQATNNPVFYSATVLPGGLAINSQTGKISGTTLVVGETTLTITASNQPPGNQNETNTSTGTIILRILPVLPNITNPLVINTSLGRRLVFPLSATGIPEPSFEVSPLPPGLVREGRTIKGTPLQGGTINAMLTATNSAGTDTKQILINVTAPPKITSNLVIPGALTEPIQYRITATNSPNLFGFPTGTIAGGINITSGPDDGTATGFLYGTPTVAGRFVAEVTASNNINANTSDPCTFSASTATGRARVIFAISTAPNAPAFFSEPDISCVEAKPFAVAAEATNLPTSYDFNDLATPDDDPIMGFNDSVPTWLSINTSSGIISGIPPVSVAPFNGSTQFRFTLRARNAAGVGRLPLTITVNAAQPRFITDSLDTLIARPEVPFEYQVVQVFNFPPEARVSGLTYSMVISPALPSGNIVINPVTGKITGTPVENQDEGTYTMTVTATNNQGTFVGDFTLFVASIDPDSDPETPDTKHVITQFCPADFKLYRTASITNARITGVVKVPTADVTAQDNLNLVIESNGPGRITGTPGAGTVGDFDVTIDCDELPPFDIRVTVTATPPNPQAPVLTGPVQITDVVEGQATDFGIALTPDYTLPLNAMPPLVFSSQNLPTGIALRAGSDDTVIQSLGSPAVRIGGVPTAAGASRAELSVVNAVGSYTREIPFTIAPVQIVSALTAEGTVGLPFFVLDIVPAAGDGTNETSYFIRASGSANEFSASNLPPGLSINPQSGEISGIPIDTGLTTDQVTNVQITASNGLSSDSKTLVITIHPRPVTAPNISNATPLAVSIFDGQDYTPPNPSIYDVNATGGVGTVTFRAIGLPQGLVIDPATGVISGKTSQRGPFAVTVIATANQGTPGNLTDDQSDAEILNLTVLAVPPVLNTSNFNSTVEINKPFTIPINYTGSLSITLSTVLTDLPPGVILTNQSLTGIPTKSGIFPFDITATGQAAPSDTEQFTLIVVEKPAITDGSNISDNLEVAGTVGVPLNYLIQSKGFEPPTFTISATDLQLLTNVGLSFNGTSITGTPTMVGVVSVLITATNSRGVDTATLKITIEGIKINPPLTVGGAVGQPFSYTISATGNPTTFAASPLPAGLSLSGATISGVPVAAGQTRANLTVGNALATAQATLVIAISTSPGVPAISSGLIAPGVLNEPFSYAIGATNSPTSFSSSALPAGLSVVPSTGQIIGSPTVSGSFTVTITATNAIGSGSAQLLIAIAAVRDGPAITSPLTATAVQGQAFTYTITSVGNPPPTFDAGGLPAGLTVNSITGVISGTPSVSGTFNVALQASNFASVTQTLVLTVVSQGAVITSPTTVTSPVGQAFSYIITATGVTPITYSITGTLPSGLTFDPATAAITGVPTVEGTTNVTMTASNAFGTDNKTLTITIGPRAPLITSSLTASGQTNVPFTYQITASGSTPITYAVAGLPPGLSVDTATGLISGTPGSVGTFNIFLSATNALGSDQKTLVLTVTEALDDFDQDGFPNELEIALGTDPQNPNSTPFGGAKITERGILSLTSVKIRLNFSTVGKDSVSQKGSFALPAGYVLTNKNVTVVVGGLKADLGGLTDKGSAAVGTNKVSIKPGKNGAPAKYSLTLKGDLKSNFTDEGLTNDNIDKKLNATRTVRTFLLIDATGATPLIFENSKQLLYTAKQGKTGSASGK